MPWVMIIIVLWGDRPATQVVEPFKTEEACNVAADKVRKDFKTATGGYYNVVVTCVGKG